MNSNKISCQKYVSSNSLFKIIPYLGVVSEICISDIYENINKPLNGAYLEDFSIDIRQIMVTRNMKILNFVSNDMRKCISLLPTLCHIKKTEIKIITRDVLGGTEPWLKSFHFGFP